MKSAVKIRLAKEMRELFFATGQAGRAHELWESIGPRQEKWIRLVEIADNLLRAVHGQEHRTRPIPPDRGRMPRAGEAK
jgi:hypothetical protein